MPEKFLVRRVDIGIGNLDISTEDLDIHTQVVVQDVTAIDENGQERRFILLYDPERVAPMADTLREAAERAGETPE